MEQAKYDLYELLEMLVERTAWPSEQTRLDLLYTINVSKQLNAFGALSHLVSCPHETTSQRWFDRTTIKNVCDDCGKVF